MDQFERDRLAGVIGDVATLYGKSMTRPEISNYINAMVKFIPDSFENYMKAFDEYTKDIRNKYFPAPASLTPYLRKSQSSDGIANEVSSRIRSAISKFGWPSPAAAREYIGELGWEVVKRSGGWQHLCENLGVTLQPLTFHAQARDLAKSLHESAALGVYDQPIQIENQNNNSRLDGVIKQLANAKKLKE